MPRIQSKPAALTTPTTQARKPPAATKPSTGSTGWATKPGASLATQARALSAHLKSPEGAAKAARIMSAIMKKNDLAHAIRVDASHIKSVKPTADGNFDVNVQFDTRGPGSKVTKSFFSAVVDGAGKVLLVPQG